VPDLSLSLSLSLPPLADLPLAPGPERLAQLELLQLAGGGAHQLVTELDRLRALVTRQRLRQWAISLGSARAGTPGAAPRTPSPSRPTCRDGTPITATSATSGWLNTASSTSIDETFSPPVMITSFLRSEMVTRTPPSTVPPSPVWNQPSTIAARGGLRLSPVALEHVVRAGEHLPVGVHAHPHADRW
jgi:hypothetical protein